jgi:hypothetical protein
LMDGRPMHGPTDMHGYMDAEWATCPITRRSMGGGNVMLAGGVVGYKAGLLPTVAMSSTESEFMEAAVMGRMFLYCRSVMWDMGVPQCAATVAYEDNDACTMMAQAQKPTARARHIDVKYHVLCQWVEQDLIKLERIASRLNIADIFTKQLGPLLFRRHCDYLMGRVPPQYTRHYDDMHERTSPLRLTNDMQKEQACPKEKGKWAAAAAKVEATGKWEEAMQYVSWGRIVSFWSRTCVESVLE